MDWHDRSGEIYLHAILTVLINSGLAVPGQAVFSEPGVFISKPTWKASAKMGESRQTPQAAFVFIFATVLQQTCRLKCP